MEMEVIRPAEVKTKVEMRGYNDLHFPTKDNEKQSGQTAPFVSEWTLLRRCWGLYQPRGAPRRATRGRLHLT